MTHSQRFLPVQDRDANRVTPRQTQVAPIVSRDQGLMSSEPERSALGGSREQQAGQQLLLEMVTPAVHESIVAVQRFFPGNRTKYPDPYHFWRLSRRIVGKGRLDDKLAYLNVLVLTPPRLVVFTKHTSRPTNASAAQAAVNQFAEWPRAELTATAEHVQLTVRGSGFGGEVIGYKDKNYVRLSLVTPQGKLVADLEENAPATHRMTDELIAKTSREAP